MVGKNLSKKKNLTVRGPEMSTEDQRLLKEMVDEEKKRCGRSPHVVREADDPSKARTSWLRHDAHNNVNS
jgi:hypothetical protein